MPAALAQHGNEQIRGAVDDLRMLVEFRGCADEAGQPQRLPDAVQRTERRLGLGQEIEAAKLGGLLPVGHAHIGAQLPLIAAAIRPARHLARDE